MIAPSVFYPCISVQRRAALARKQRFHLFFRCQTGHGNGVVVPERLSVPGDAGQSIAAACLFDQTRDRILCIYAGSPDSAELAKAMRKLVPKYMLPNIYEKLDALPYNANGKIDRVQLKERYLHAEN